MLDSTVKGISLTRLFLIVSLIGFSALWYSPAVVSISSIVLIVLPLANYSETFNKTNKWISITLFLLLFVYILDLVISEDSSIPLAKFSLFIAFVGVQISSFIMLGKVKKHLVNVFLIFTLIVLIINSIAVTNYFLNKEYFDEMLRQSKSIPILNMHHIHFGIINAIIILGLVGLLLLDMVQKYRRLFAIIGLVIIGICFHILSSRTGMVSVYGGLFVALIVFAIRKKSFKLLVIGAVSALIFLGGAYFLSSSFQSKLANSVEDFRSWGNGDINYKSMGMRFDAYKSCTRIISENPMGVGASDQEREMQRIYIDRNTVLSKENRIGPHNQFLEYGVKFGWIGMILLAFYILSLFNLLPNSQFPFWGCLVTLLIALQFESLLERQTSIYFVSLLVPYIYHLFKLELINGEKVT